MIKTKASFRLTGWNANQLKLRVPQILAKYQTILDQQLKEEIRLPQFPWPNPTRRSNGTVVFSPRNIVDTGAFLGSQRRTFDGRTTITFSWGATDGVDYAGRILSGQGARWGKDGPPRNWISSAISKRPLDSFFAKEWRRLERNRL